MHWPETFRPFADYEQHLDAIAISDFDDERASRASDRGMIDQEAWRIALRKRSSPTREYLGAVTSLQALRDGEGEFVAEADSYRFWRRHRFEIGEAAQHQLDKLTSASKKPPRAFSGSSRMSRVGG